MKNETVYDASKGVYEMNCEEAFMQGHGYDSPSQAKPSELDTFDPIQFVEDLRSGKEKFA